MKRVRSAGRALQANRKRQSIPPERLQELTSVLRTHFGTDDVTEQMEDEAASINCLEVIEECNLHSCIFTIIVTTIPNVIIIIIPIIIIIIIVTKVDYFQVNGDYIPHSRAVVQHHMTTEGLSLIQLESRWRQHFIDTMKPRLVSCKIKSCNYHTASGFCLIYGLWTIRLRGWT